MNNIIGNRRNGKQVFYTLNGRMNIGGAGVLMNVSVDNFAVRVAGKSAPSDA
jgi:hypothetical protein